MKVWGVEACRRDDLRLGVAVFECLAKLEVGIGVVWRDEVEQPVTRQGHWKGLWRLRVESFCGLQAHVHLVVGDDDAPQPGRPCQHRVWGRKSEYEP